MEIKNLWPHNDIDEEELKQSTELLTELMNKAAEGKNSDFRFITCWGDRIVVKEYIYGVDAVIRIFADAETNSLKLYSTQIGERAQDLGLILSIKQFNQCKNYYQKEREIAEDMLAEYRSYIWGGHIWDTLVGNIRKEEDLVDYRTLPIKWF